MSNRNYESQILDAIQILVDNTVAKANYDKTIKATISRCVDPTIGKYVIKYQNSSFYAYSYNTENKYAAGSAVYVLVPGNDMSQEKSIIGTVDKLGIDYVSIIEGENGYEVTGLNVIKTHADYGLCSYKTQDVKVLYNRDEDINLLEIDVVGLKTYIEQSSSIICGATFKTELSTQQKTRGDYGIGFDLDFIDNATGENVTRTYILNIDQMTGQPYNYNTPSRQYDIFEVDGRNFMSIKQIYIFSYNFPYNEENKPDDIFVSNIELSAANALDKETVSTAILSFITPQGIYFDDNNLDTDTKTIEAQIKIKGQNIDNDSQKDSIEYYWFKENDSISSKSQKYHKIGGAGWECLNLCNIIEEATEEQEAIVSWVPGDYKLLTAKNNNIAKETKYKCVAVYKKETTLSKIITIYNHSSDYNIVIKSDAGTVFYYDLGTPTLTCFVNDKEELEDDYTYVWSSVDSKNRFTTIQETSTINGIYNEKLARYNELQSQIENNMVLISEVETELQECKQTLDQYEFTMRVEKNKIHQLKVSEITNFATYKCSVFKSDVLIGTASIIISNSLQNDSEYSLVINNGDQIFKYNEQGISPTSLSLENPQKVLPLTFTIYDNQGRVVSEKTLKQREISWYVPVDRTLIDLEGIYDNPDEINGEIGTYYDLTEFNFKLATRYSATNTNNNIRLEVQYKDKKLTAQTNFIFIKTGEIGTNGTDFVCKIIPNTDTDIVPSHPTVIYNEYLKTYQLNYNTLNNKWFKVQLWNDGERIFEGTQTGISTEDKEVKVSWSILANNYGNNLKDYSNLSIDKNSGVITFDATEYEHPANIVKCTVLYNKVEYYAVMPVIISRIKNADYEILLTEGYGFTSVMYTPDGKNPTYNMVSPHDITVNQIINGVKENISLYEPENYKVDYAWGVKGNVYYAEEQLSQNLLENKAYKNKEKINRRFYKPSDIYNGLCVNNAIVCTITQKGEKIGSIHMPVHLYLNRYGNSAINGWDGNSIDIGANDGKLILAPQVGAGTKDEQTNTFTGVFMGSIKETGKTEEEHGLFGYHDGQRTITLNAADGSAKFGKEGLGQIVIDPNVETAQLKSGSYTPAEYDAEGNLIKAGSGMLIDLAEPSIKFGSGKFSVDAEGNVRAEAFATKDEIKDLEESVSLFNVTLDRDSIIIPVDGNHNPIENGSEQINFKVTYKGKDHTWYTNEITSTSIPGIEETLNKENIIFTFEKDIKILNAVNTCSIKFKYTDAITLKTFEVIKNITIALAIQGKDGKTGEDGAPGESGKSAYEIWLDAGFTGTEEDYLASLKGEPGEDGEDGKVLYTWIKYSNGDASSMSDDPTGKTHIGIAYNKETAIESNTYNDYTWSLIKGSDGEAGYTPVKGKDYFDGEDGADAIKIKTIKTQYYLSSSKTQLANGSWLDTQPAWKANYYFWIRDVIVWDTNPETTTPTTAVLAESLNQANETANTANSTATSANTTASNANSKADNAVSTANSASETANSAKTTADTASSKASNAETTANQAKTKAETVEATIKTTVKEIDVQYAISSDPGTAPTSGWDSDPPAWVDGKYIWSRNVVTYVNGNSTPGEAVCITGGKGASGEKGAGISSITELYFAKGNTTVPTKPSAAVTVNNAAAYNQWNQAMPTYHKDYPHYFTCSEMLDTDGNRTWSTPIYAGALTTANQNAATAKSDAATAKSDASTAKTNAETALSKAKTADTNASEAKDAIDNLEIGGRNIWLDSSFNVGDELTDYYNVTPHTGTIKRVNGFDENSAVELSRTGYSSTELQRVHISSKNPPTYSSYKKGDVFCLSAWVYVDSSIALDGDQNNIMIRGTHGDVPSIQILKSAPVNTWILYTAEWTAPADGTFSNCYVLLEKNGKIRVSQIKLEKGTTPTDWTAAPEDISAQMVIKTETQYCKNKDAKNPPLEGDAGWETKNAPKENNVADGEFLWVRTKNFPKAGAPFYSNYFCLIQTQKVLVSQTTEYLLSSKSTSLTDAEKAEIKEGQTSPPVSNWTVNKPTTENTDLPYLWTRTHAVYNYYGENKNDGKPKHEYYDYTLDTSWHIFFKLAKGLDEKITGIMSDLTGGYVHINDGVILIGDDADEPHHLIVMNHNGIAFFDNPNPNEGWPKPDVYNQATSAWTIDGHMNMQEIEVEGLTATSIANENLMLGKSSEKAPAMTGDLDIFDKYGNLIFETVVDEGQSSSTNYIQGFKIQKYYLDPDDNNKYKENGYIYLSKEGFKEYNRGDKVIFGNNNDEFASLTNKTNKQIITSQLPDATASDTDYGIQMIPMQVSNIGDGIQKHTGVAFLKL